MKTYRVDNYTPQQKAVRDRIFACLRDIEDRYRKEAQPFLTQLAEIEKYHEPKYYIMPNEE